MTDNASSNDTMVIDLELTLPNFEGKLNHMRCINHSVNLIARSTLQLFDIPKKKGRTNEDDTSALDQAEAELWQLAEDIELEDVTTQRDSFANSLTEETNDDKEDVIDILQLLNSDEIAKFCENILPV